MEAGVERATREIDEVERGGWSVLEESEELVAVALAPGPRVESKDGAHVTALRVRAPWTRRPRLVIDASWASSVSAPRPVIR